MAKNKAAATDSTSKAKAAPTRSAAGSESERSAKEVSKKITPKAGGAVSDGKKAASAKVAANRTVKTKRKPEESKPSVAKRVLRKVRSAASGVASLAGTVVGRR